MFGAFIKKAKAKEYPASTTHLLYWLEQLERSVELLKLADLGRSPDWVQQRGKFDKIISNCTKRSGYLLWIDCDLPLLGHKVAY